MRRRIETILVPAFFLLAIVTTGKLYTLPKAIFPYSPPGFHEAYEQEWDGRSNPVVPTGGYQYYTGGYSDILFRNVISSILLCYIAYRTGRILLVIDCYSTNHISTFLYFWYSGTGSLSLYNFGWICRATAWEYARALSLILFILSVITFIISILVVPSDILSPLRRQSRL